MNDLQRSALINEGLYQLGAHGWYVNISAVTQIGTRRRVTPLFTEHKEHKQALATSTQPSVNGWAAQRIYGSSTSQFYFRGGKNTGHHELFYWLADMFLFLRELTS